MAGSRRTPQLELSVRLGFSEVASFLSYWSSRYSDPREALYELNIGRPLTHQSRDELFKWKNGGALSARKLRSVEDNYTIPPPAMAAEVYLDPKGKGGAIWNIFYLHCLSPSEWPIYDQHTHRAMEYMLSREIMEIPSSKAAIYECYVERYRPFTAHFGDFPQRTVDRALFAFGKCLKGLSPLPRHSRSADPDRQTVPAGDDLSSHHAIGVRVTADTLSVDLADGRTISAPLAWFPRLAEASETQRARWEFCGGGEGIHWPDVDEDVSVEGLLRGAPAPGHGRATGA